MELEFDLRSIKLRKRIFFIFRILYISAFAAATVKTAKHRFSCAWSVAIARGNTRKRIIVV